MTSDYDTRGRRVAATVLEITPNLVIQTKAKDGKDGYNALQLGTGNKKSLKKPQLGAIKKAGLNDRQFRWIKEVRVDEVTHQPGQEILASAIFSPGDSVKVTGVSKGRGFQGGVKRYNFQGGPKTHGQSDRHRAPGSIGSGTTPGRVYKGKRMAGHYGVDTVSVRGLEVIRIDNSHNLLVVKGGIPGHIGGLVQITKLGRIKGYTPPPEEKVDEEAAEELKTPEPSIEQPVETSVVEDSTAQEETKDASQ